MKNSQEILDNELELSGHARFLKKYGMYSAALYYKNLNEPIERRAARAVRYVLKNLPTPNYYDFPLCQALIRKIDRKKGTYLSIHTSFVLLFVCAVF